MNINLKLRPFTTPSFVIAETPPKERQEGFNPDGAPKFHLKELDAQALSDLCDAFRAEVFQKAEKTDFKRYTV